MKVGGKQQALLTAVSLIVLVLTVVTLAVSGNRNAAIAPGGPSPDDAQQILIHGLRDQDITITLGDLKKLPTVTRYAEATRSNGEEVQVLATGPLLDTLLKKYGKSQQEFSRIRFTARDNYAIAVPADILKNCQIVLSYINDGKPLEEDWQPVRVVIPGARSMNTGTIKKITDTRLTRVAAAISFQWFLGLLLTLDSYSAAASNARTTISTSVPISFIRSMEINDNEDS